MKKLITLALSIIIVMSTTMPVSAEEKAIFEKDLTVCKEKGYLSVYRQSIRENIKGEWAKEKRILKRFLKTRKQI